MKINSEKLWEQLRGRSAYEIAVLNGYTGTIQEWLISLKGPIGGDTTLYSLTEAPVNKVWLDNKQIYRKVINCGNLTNASMKSILHGISNIEQITDFVVIVKFSDNSFATITKRANSLSSTLDADLDVKINSTGIQIYSTGDNTDKVAYAIIEYTKTTDSPLTSDELDQIGNNKGATGKSAYEVAVDNGFTGTEVEWLASLKKPALPIGGENGQFLVKNSDVDQSATWQYINVDFRYYRHEQLEASNIWTINHNLNSNEFIYQAKNNDNESLICDIDILSTTNNTLVLNFTKPTDGYCLIYTRTSEFLPVPTRNIMIDQYGEKVINHDSFYGTKIISILDAPIQKMKLLNDTIISFSDWYTNKSSSVTLSIDIDDISPNIIFNGNIKWESGIIPELISNTTTRITFTSDDGGQTIYGYIIGYFK